MKFRVCLLMILAFSWASFTAAETPPLPDPTMSVAWIENGGPHFLSIMITPNGSGDAFSQAFLPDGSRTSGVVHLQLIDAVGNPMPNYPREDLWLDALDGGLVFCASGNWADTFTDVNGETTFSQPLRGGGSSQDLTQVFVSGMALVSSAGLPLRFNSPDLNGDLRVDLGDVVVFAGDFFGGVYQYRSDFHTDGVINLSDLTRMVTSIGADCP